MAKCQAFAAEDKAFRAVIGGSDFEPNSSYFYVLLGVATTAVIVGIGGLALAK